MEHKLNLLTILGISFLSAVMVTIALTEFQCYKLVLVHTTRVK